MDDENAMIDAMEQELFDTGAMYIDGVDDDGEVIVKFNMDILKEVNPNLWHWWQDEVDSALLDMSAQGLVELDFSDPSGVIVNITEKGLLLKEIASE